MKGMIATIAALAVASALPAQAATPACAELAAKVLERSNVVSATSSITAASGNTPAYCQVDLQVEPVTNIRVGLPLNATDGGTGGVSGAWNRKVQNLGGGGFAGTVGEVGSATAAGYIGSSTDTGHSAQWCSAINLETGFPNAYPCPPIFGAGFVLDPSNNALMLWQVKEFMTRSLLKQVQWSLLLGRMYYRMQPLRNYWVGCSTGGRQGFELAQKHGDLFDGFVVGHPAMNWNRFQTGELWPYIVVKDLLGPAGLAPDKIAAANDAARAACDAKDGVVDGLISEPRRCKFDARKLICTGDAGDPGTCLTRTEARALNLIWDGPRNQRGERLWGGPTRGTDLTGPLSVLPAGNQPNPLPDAYTKHWVHQNPAFDTSQITMESFAEEFQLSDRKFRNDLAETDNPDLDKVRARGAKIIHYHGTEDNLIIPFGSWHYVSSVFDRYGVEETRSFMRSFFYPGVGHCSGGAPGAPQPNPADLLQALERWVETGVAPDYVVARTGDDSRSRKICAYPDETVYKGPGSTDDYRFFGCRRRPVEPPDLRADSATAERYHEAQDPFEASQPTTTSSARLSAN